MLAHLESTRRATPDLTIDILENGGGHVLVMESHAVGRADGIETLAPAIKATLFDEVIEREPYVVGFHAAAVSQAGKCLLLPAVAESGKTTLTAALVKAGFGYLTDDVCLLDDATMEARGVPFSLAIKSTGVDALTPHYPELATLPMHVRADEKSVCYLPPPGARLDQPSASVPVRWIVFPRYDPTGRTALEPVAKAAAFHRLVELSATRGPLDAGRVAQIVEWFRDLTCWELSIGSLSVAVETLGKLCAENDRIGEFS